MSLMISLGDYLVKNRFVYRAKHIFFCSACGSSISQAIYGKIKAYVNSGCVFSLIEPVNMPHMWPDALPLKQTGVFRKLSHQGMFF